MQRIILILSLVLLSTFAFSQRPQGSYGGKRNASSSITGKITGRVIDTLNKEPIGFATIVLFKSGEQKELNGNISEDDGKFKLADVKTGTYDLQLSFIGYKTRMYRGLQLTPKKPDINLGDLYLVADNVLLDAVEVVEEASVIENRVDKIVYNADKDVTSTGGDAADVLRKVPLLSVDFEGNVSLRGNSNLRILINGKPSGMFSANVAEALKMMPADQIKSVEVITTPSAKYDGEGTGGIINIITKKKSIEGVSGTVSTAVGNRQNNASLNINAVKGRFGANASGFSYFSLPVNANTSFIRKDLVNGQYRTLDQSGVTETSRIGFRGTGGAFYDINAYNSLNSTFSIGGHSSNRDGLSEVNYMDPITGFNQAYTRTNDGTNGVNSFDWTTDYTKTFPLEGQELALAFQLSGSNQNNDTDYSQENISNATDFVEEGRNDGDNREYIFQLDYTHPFSKKFKLEIGAKSTLRRLNSDYSYTPISGASTTPFRSDIFKYNQDVIAGYTSINWTINKNWGIVAGTRFESTELDGSYVRDGETFDNSYSNLLPSIIISRKLKNFQTLKLSFTQRIQRPSLFYINPFTNAADRRNISVGNPELDPETVDQIELSYNTFVKGVVINAAVFHRKTNDIIESFLTVNEEGVSVTNYQNIGENNSIGFNLFTSANIKKKLTIRGGFNFFTYNVEGIANDVKVSRKSNQMGGNFSATLSLKKNWKVEAFAFGRGRRQTVQGSIPSFWMYSIGIKKDIWKKRGSIGLRMVEPFNETKAFITELETDSFSQRSEFHLPFRSFGINFSYRFGKLDFKAKKKRGSKIKNTDLKSGDGNNY
jgi:outer membrane receptor protein involved in Fe transport